MAKIHITPGDEGGDYARTPLLLGAVAYEQNEKDAVAAVIDEEWTARKALRRAVEHEREYTWHLEQILGQSQNAVGKN